MTPEAITFLTKALAGTMASSATALISDTTLVDLIVALFGGFIAMTPREHGGSIQIWQGLVGIAMGVGIGLILRSGDMPDITIRAVIFVGSILSTMLVYWLRNPAQGLEAVKAFASAIQKILGAFTGK